MSALWPKDFTCPPTMRPHVQRVLDGEYALPSGYALEPPVRVLDIGANVGAFAVWAQRQWRECELWCYEPNPETYKTLETNMRLLPCKYYLAEVAVGGKERGDSGTLYSGKHNCGESSLVLGPEQNLSMSYYVSILNASELPGCEVLKVDTEGCELEILQHYRHLRTTLVVMLEWHSLRDRWQIGALLSETHDCVRDEQWSSMPPRGIMVWVQQ